MQSQDIFLPPCLCHSKILVIILTYLVRKSFLPASICSGVFDNDVFLTWWRSMFLVFQTYFSKADSGAVMGDGSTELAVFLVGACDFLAQRPFLCWTDGQYLVSLIYLKSAKQESQCWWRGCFVCLPVNRNFNCFQLRTNNCVRTEWRKCLKPTEERGVRDKLRLIQPPGLNLGLWNWGYNSHCSSVLKFFWPINANGYIFSLAS